MSRAELKVACQALATVGDARAVATLELFKEFETQKSVQVAAAAISPLKQPSGELVFTCGLDLLPPAFTG